MREPCSASSDSAQATVRAPREALGAHERKRSLRGHELRAVDQRQALLRDEADRLEPDARERRRAVEQLAFDAREPLADERQREVRERGEIARRTDGAARRHDRQHAACEAFEQQLDRLDARARVSLRKRVRAQQHGRPDDRVGVRISDPAGVRAEQTQLQLPGQLLRDLLRDEAAEAGVDAVGVLVRAVGGALDEPRAPRASWRGRRPTKAPEDATSTADRPDVTKGEIVAGQSLRRGHTTSLERTGAMQPSVSCRAP